MDCILPERGEIQLVSVDQILSGILDTCCTTIDQFNQSCNGLTRNRTRRIRTHFLAARRSRETALQVLTQRGLEVMGLGRLAASPFSLPPDYRCAGRRCISSS